jgi:hypothetical protein
MIDAIHGKFCYVERRERLGLAVFMLTVLSVEVAVAGVDVDITSGVVVATGSVEVAVGSVEVA